MQPRSAGAMGLAFPYRLQTMCYIEVHASGEVTHGRDSGTYDRVVAGESRLFAVWPGQWRSDLFAVDDMDEYAKAFGLVHDEKRTGVADHEHELTWSTNQFEGDNPRSPYIWVSVKLQCGCEIRDIGTFAAQMRDQRGWDVATSTGWGRSGSDTGGWTYSIRVRRKSLER